LARADLVRDELEKCGIEFLVWLPDSEARYFYDSIAASPRLTLVQVCHEEEAMGICVGLYLGGKNAAVLIQNTGFFHSIDSLRGLVMDMGMPMLLMIGYRGYHEMLDGKTPPDSAAVFTEPILDTLGITHYLLDRDEDVENISRAYKETQATNRPVAVLIGREYSE
jgi:sulfopyruvate decarboxylase subunit alpha